MTAALERPGSPLRALWLYLSSTAALWVLWTLAWLVIGRVEGESQGAFWGLAVYLVYVDGILIGLVANAVVWFTLGWLIDAKARPAWPWQLALGLVLGGWIAVGFRDANPYALIAGAVITVGGFVLGPMLAERTFVSANWRIAVASTMAVLLGSVVAALWW